MAEIKRTLICIVICFCILSGRAAAQEVALPEELEREVPQASQLMNGSAQDLFGLWEGAETLLRRALSDGRQYILSGVRSLASILVGIVLLGVVESVAGDGIASRRSELIGALFITAISAGDINALIGLGRDTIGNIDALSKVLIPALAAATAASGGVTGATVRQISTVFFSDVLLTIIDRLLIPMLYLFIACAAATAVLDSGVLEGFAAMIKKIVGWVLGVLLSLFTAYLSISGAVAGAVDAQTVRVAKAAVGAAVPVVGGILSDAADVLVAGAGVMRSMIGAFGALAIIALCTLPFLRLGGQYLLYQAGVFVAQAAGPKKLAGMLKMLADAFALMLAMTGASALLLIISLVSTLTVVTA